MSAGNGDHRIGRTRAVATTVLIGCGTLGLLTLAAACGSTATVFNPAFLNTLSGGYLPVTPGPGAAFVLVRVVNDTTQVVEFVVTIEREVLVVDDDGNFEQDEQGNFITVPERKTVNVTTNATGLATDMGVLFPCGESPVTLVGLGANLLPTDAAVFVGGEGAGGAAGFGVPAGSLYPLSLKAGNFNCGDTIIFQAFVSTGVAGGVSLLSWLLPGSEQPDEFRGPDTFVNLEDYIESQVSEDDGP